MDDHSTRTDPMGPAGDELHADAILPAQFYPGRRRSASVEPILRLMAGILIDAVRCLQRNFRAVHRNGQRDFREARHWIFDESGGGPFSFEDVCDALKIDSQHLRGLILRWENDRRSSDKRAMTPSFPVDVSQLVQARRGRPKRSSDSDLHRANLLS